MIINKSTVNFPDCVFILNQEDIKRWYGKEIYSIEKYYGKDIDWIKYTHQLHVENDLEAWQNMFPHYGCYVLLVHMAELNFKTREWTVTECNLYCDGYSQVEDSLSGGVDKQVFMSDEWINLFVAHIDGGIAVRINKITYEILFYAIGEDDGHWFLTNALWFTNINYWKGLIMSEISELHISEFNHQIVIEKIWNGDLRNIEKCLR